MLEIHCYTYLVQSIKIQHPEAERISSMSIQTKINFLYTQQLQLHHMSIRNVNHKVPMKLMQLQKRRKDAKMLFIKQNSLIKRPKIFPWRILCFLNIQTWSEKGSSNACNSIMLPQWHVELIGQNTELMTCPLPLKGSIIILIDYKLKSTMEKDD